MHPSLKTLLIHAAVPTLVSLGSVGAATAAIIFDGGSPNQQNGFEVTRWVGADDFVLTALTGTTLKGVHFWTLEGGAWDGTLDYYLFTDESGQPASTPFAQGAGTNVTKTDTGATVLGLSEYEYNFDLPVPLPLLANTTYWLGLHLSSNFVKNNIYWETTSSSLGSNSTNSDGGTFTNWETNTDENFAFHLVGSDATPVPTPLPLVGAFTAFSFSRQLRKRSKVHHKAKFNMAD